MAYFLKKTNAKNDAYLQIYESFYDPQRKASAHRSYNLLVTSEVNLTDHEIYTAYHNLWRIEESFRIMKSELDARPVYLQQEVTITGHFPICCLTVLPSRIL